MRVIRTLLALKLGFWAGAFASASAAETGVPSRGDAESDEMSLVAILNGVEMKSRAQAFRGG